MGQRARFISYRSAMLTGGEPRFLVFATAADEDGPARDRREETPTRRRAAALSEQGNPPLPNEVGRLDQAASVAQRHHANLWVVLAFLLIGAMLT